MVESGNTEFRMPPEFVAQTPGAFVMLFRYHKKNLLSKKQLQILLVHRKDYNLWNLPGGGFDETKEDEIDAAIRETYEETNLEVGVIPESSIRTLAGPDECGIPGEARHDRFVAYIGVIIDGELTTSDEAKAIRWWDITKLPKNIYMKHEVLIGITTSSFWQPKDTKEIIDFSIESHRLIPETIDE